jgi:hypothetical protein
VEPGNNSVEDDDDSDDERESDDDNTVKLPAGVKKNATAQEH